MLHSPVTHHFCLHKRVGTGRNSTRKAFLSFPRYKLQTEPPKFKEILFQLVYKLKPTGNERRTNMTVR